MVDAQIALTGGKSLDLAKIISMLVYEGKTLEMIAGTVGVRPHKIRELLSTPQAEQLYLDAHKNRLLFIADVPIASQRVRLERLERLYERSDRVGDREECRRILAEARTEVFSTVREFGEGGYKGQTINVFVTDYHHADQRKNKAVEVAQDVGQDQSTEARPPTRYLAPVARVVSTESNGKGEVDT